MAFRPIPYLATALQLWALLCLPSIARAGQAQFATNPTRFLVCNHGDGSFQGRLPLVTAENRVTVIVGAAKKNNFALRACQARLWDGLDLVVASEAAQADIDVMGADLGLGSLVVAFQIKATDADPHIQYRIYSLSTPPQLLRTITGEDYFSAADSRLDGSVEIWTTDAAAVNGFEGLPRSAFDVAPAIILRFEQKKLIDVSSEFRPYYDQQIEAFRSHLDAQQLSEFRNSDGKLSSTDPAANGMKALIATKVKVLEIVWAYLASGREPEAWDALARMWPAADLDRIRAAMLNAQARGMRSQVDGVSHQPPQAQQKHSFVYRHIVPHDYNLPPDARARFSDTVPERLVWKAAPPRNPEDWATGKELELVVDEAGKVRSVKTKGEKQKDEPDQDWIDASAGWKYIPAYKDGHPVAFLSKSHVRRNQ